MECLTRWGVPGIIVADRWREAELREHLERVEFPLTGLAVRGQGFRDGGEDVRVFRKAVLDGRVSPERGRRERARDDAAAACILALAEGMRRAATPRPGEALRAIVV